MKARIVLSISLACLAALALAGSAGAAVTIGQTAPKPEDAYCASFLPFDDVTQSVSSGPSYAVPAGGGVITSWSTLGGIDVSSGGQLLGLDILHRTGYATYTKIAEDGPRAIAPESLNVFNVEIPVNGGDLIGIDGPSFGGETGSFCTFETAETGNESSYIEPHIAVGKSAEFFTEAGGNYRVNISATLVSPPRISSLKPSSGSIDGSKVTIDGAEFDKVSGVSFGGAPASAVKVTSEGQMVAKAPKRKKPGPVPVTVTSFAGSSAVPATYTYEACKVPKLGGNSLTSAKHRLKAAGCRLGKVSTKDGATPQSGVVAAQQPKPGRLAGTGTKVAVTLGP